MEKFQDAQAASETLPTVLFHKAAQEMYDQMHNDSSRITITVSRLFDTMSARHCQTGMREHRPGQADYLEMRVVWNALVAPILHGAELKLVEEMLPSIESGVALILPGDLESELYDCTFTRPYSGLPVTFLRAMAPWSAAAGEKFLYELGSDTNHPYRPIWEIFCTYHPYFCHLEKQSDRGLNRSLDPVDSIMELMIDNETIFGLLEPAGKHFSVWGSDWEQDERRSFSTITEQLSWAASTKRNLVAKYMGRNMRPKICPFADGPLSMSEGEIWTLKMLQGGRQDPPGFCPANVVLQSPLQRERDIVEALYHQIYYASGNHPRVEERAYGASSVAELRLNTGGFILSELAA